MSNDYQPFASVDDLEKYWKPLADSDERAKYLLALASSRLRLMADDTGFDIDQKYSENENYANAVKWVVLEAVKRALATPIDTPPVDNYSQSAGPYSENYKFTNPSGDLWFKKAELKAIGVAGVQQVDSISPITRKDVYGE